MTDTLTTPEPLTLEVAARRIAEHLTAHAVEISMEPFTMYGSTRHKLRFLIDGVDVGESVQLNTEVGSYLYGRKGNGKLRLRVVRTSLPQRKDGTHDYPRAAQILVAERDRIEIRDRDRDIRHGNRQLAEDLAKELGTGESLYGGPVIQPSPAAAGKVEVILYTFREQLTPDQARKLIWVLREIGVR